MWQMHDLEFANYPNWWFAFPSFGSKNRIRKLRISASNYQTVFELDRYSVNNSFTQLCLKFTGAIGCEKREECSPDKIDGWTTFQLEKKSMLYHNDLGRRQNCLFRRHSFRCTLTRWSRFRILIIRRQQYEGVWKLGILNGRRCSRHQWGLIGIN